MATSFPDIYCQTSFKVVTGRNPGQEAKEVIRKGIVGEWIEGLKEKEKILFWKVGKDLLELFGYTENGELRNFPENSKFLHWNQK